MKPTTRQRLRYHFDNLMARGTPALIGLLFALSLVIVIIAGAVLSVTGFVQEGTQERLSFWEAVWESLMRTLDPGTMGADTGSGFRAVMLFVTLGGIFVVSTLIGVLNNALTNQMEHLRKGRSHVLETNHTLILGWSTQIFTIINELMIANENQPRARIVILADRDKVEMEDEIRERVQVRGKTRIICRNGNPIDPNDLEIVSPHSAKSIIVLPPDTSNPDTEVIKTVLAITNDPNRRPEPYHIVTQVHRARNLDALKLIGRYDHVQAVLTGDVIARVVAQTSRQSGLSMVYTELMNFSGDEIYFKHEPALEGKTFGEALQVYEDSCVMGLRKADGRILLGPPMETRIEREDQIVALSADDDTIRLAAQDRIRINESAICSSSRVCKPQPEKCLILGWNPSGMTIVGELDHYVVKGSQVTVVADMPDIEKQIISRCGNLQNQTLTVEEGETTDRELLERLCVQDYDHVIVLADRRIDPQEADARTIVTLLHLRNRMASDPFPSSAKCSTCVIAILPRLPG